jgi:hypothetical protein
MMRCLFLFSDSDDDDDDDDDDDGDGDGGDCDLNGLLVPHISQALLVGSSI